MKVAAEVEMIDVELKKRGALIAGQVILVVLVLLFAVLLAPMAALAQTFTYATADRSVFANTTGSWGPTTTETVSSAALGLFDETATSAASTATMRSTFDPRSIEVVTRLEGKTRWVWDVDTYTLYSDTARSSSTHTVTFTLDSASLYNLRGRLRNYHGFFAYEAAPALVRLTGPAGVVFEVSHLAQGACVYPVNCETEPWVDADRLGSLEPGTYTFEASSLSTAYGYAAPIGVFDEAFLSQIEVTFELTDTPDVPMTGPLSAFLLILSITAVACGRRSSCSSSSRAY